MFNRFLFCEKWEGANPIFVKSLSLTLRPLQTLTLAFFFFLGGTVISAQGTPTSVDCEFIIHIEPVIFNPVTPTSCSTCCIQPSCTQALYRVSLKLNPANLPTGAYNNGDFDLFYKQLKITVQADVAEGGSTRINKLETENCGAPFDIIVDEVNNSASLYLSEAFVENFGDLPVISFENYETEVLFTLVVDFFPGEVTGAFVTDFLYVDINDDVCDTYSPTYYGSGVTPTTYPAPSSVNTSFRVVLGTSICTGELATFPVNMPTVGGAVDLLDFAITVETSTPMAQEPTIQVTSGQPTPSVAYQKLPNDEGYAMLFTYESVTVNTGEMFRILAEPELFSGGYTMDASLEVGRVIVSSGGCNAPGIGNAAAQCSEPGLDECSDYELLIETQTALFGSNCNELKVYASIDGPDDDFDEVYLHFEFIMDPGVSITDVQAINLTGCVATNPSANVVKLNCTSPVTWGVNSYLYIEFDSPDGCIQDVLVRNAEIMPDGDPDFCYPNVETMTFPYCTAELAGHIATETMCYVPGVEVLVFPDADPDDCEGTVTTGCGPYSKCVCVAYEDWTVVPTKDDDNNTDWLNGISVLDLTLISKHIPSVAPLASPYYIIAADVNKSGSVTTFDIVELRRVIIGYYDVSLPSPGPSGPGGELPWPSTYARSWQFVPKNFTFPNLTNPFQTAVPDRLTNLPLPTLNANFIAIKTGHVVNEDGDGVNGIPTGINEPKTGCDCNAPWRAALPEFTLTALPTGLNSGDYHVLPIYAQGNAPLNAWQMGIRFDHQALEFVGVSQGDLPGLNQDNFGLTKVSQGEIRALWIANLADEDDFVRPGQVLFYLTFRAKTDVADVSKLLRTDDDLLQGIGLATDKSTYRFELTPRREIKEREEIEEATDLGVRCRPNPSTDGFTLDVALPEASKVRLVVYDAFGRRMLFRELMLDEGQQAIPIPEASLWPAGVYRWDLRAGKMLRSKGHAVKL